MIQNLQPSSEQTSDKKIFNKAKLQSNIYQTNESSYQFALHLSSRDK